jgi:hypothetical protein
MICNIYIYINTTYIHNIYNHIYVFIYILIVVDVFLDGNMFCFFVCGEDDDTPSNRGVSKMLRQPQMVVGMSCSHYLGDV